MKMRVKGAAKPRANEYKVKEVCPLLNSRSGHTMLQDSPLSVAMSVVYMKIGVMTRAEAVQAAAETIRDTKGVLNLGAAIGWQTAIYLSALIIHKKMLLVNWLIPVDIM